MDDATALRVAIDLMRIPSRVRIARLEPLPSGVHMLLRVAAGEEAAASAAVASTSRSRDVIQKAAGFFIEQILLCPDADSYRVLGATPEATTSDVRRNMALLMRWLHPDLDPEGKRSMFASRVTLAWNDLKTVERRATYDRGRISLPAKASRTKSTRRSGGKRLSHRRAHGQRTVSHIYADGKESLLRRLIAWMGALAQLHSR
jgi:hypothetical protein